MPTPLAFLICSSLLYSAVPAEADNSLLASLFAQMKSGHFCADIKQADVRNHGLACATPFNRKLNQIAGPASWLLDTIAFDAAVAPQIRRETCVAQRARALAGLAPKRKDWWRATLVTAWLGRKKARLTLSFCDENFNTHVPPSVAADDPDGAWAEWKRMDRLTPLYPGDPKMQEARENKMKAWAPICFNADAVAALKQADEIFAYTVPVIESESLFAEIEARRDVVSSTKTGKALTDPEILATDLRDLKSVRLKLDSALNAKLDKRLDEIAASRERGVEDFRRAKDSDGHFNLSPDQRQYLYEEGTVIDALRENYGAENKARLPAALACFDARYGSQPLGELMSLAFWSGVTGGAYGALSANLKLAKALNLVAKSKKSLNAGFTLVTADQSLKEVWDTCTKTHPSYGRQLNSKDAEFAEQAESGDLPEELGFRMWDLPLDSGLTPACEDGDVKNMLIRKNETTSCAREIITNGLPNLIGLPH